MMYEVRYADKYVGECKIEYVEEHEIKFFLDKLKFFGTLILNVEKVEGDRMLINDRLVLLKALVGSHNYHLNTPTSDKDYKVFVAPTFEELYSGMRYQKSIIGKDEDLDIHDIRKIVDLFFKANVNYLEVLFSDELIIPNGYPEIEQIVKYKDDIARMNLKHLFNACGGMHLQKMKQLSNGTEGTQDLVDLYGYDTKQALHAYRVLDFIVRYEANGFKDFKQAMTYDGKELQFMLEIKNGLFNEATYRKFVGHYHDSVFVHLKEKYHEQPVNEDLKLEIERLVMQLVKRLITN